MTFFQIILSSFLLILTKRAHMVCTLNHVALAFQGYGNKHNSESSNSLEWSIIITTIYYYHHYILLSLLLKLILKTSHQYKHLKSLKNTWSIYYKLKYEIFFLKSEKEGFFHVINNLAWAISETSFPYHNRKVSWTDAHKKNLANIASQGSFSFCCNLLKLMDRKSRFQKTKFGEDCFWPFNCQPHRRVKHNQTICRLMPMCFWPFWVCLTILWGWHKLLHFMSLLFLYHLKNENQRFSHVFWGI